MSDLSPLVAILKEKENSRKEGAMVATVTNRQTKNDQAVLEEMIAANYTDGEIEQAKQQAHENLASDPKEKIRLGRNKIENEQLAVERLYQVVEKGIQLPSPRRWSDELIKMVGDYLASTRQMESFPTSSEQGIAESKELSELEKVINNSQRHLSSQQEENAKVTEQPLMSAKVTEGIQKLEDYANNPWNHLSPFAADFLRTKTHPSLIDFAVRYLTSTKEVRNRTKASVLNENELERRQYTPAEVAEMLKMFIQLDRLAYLDQVIAAERRQENAKFHINLQDAPQLRKQMESISKQMAQDQERYNQWMKRLKLRERDRTAESKEKQPASLIDYEKIGKNLNESYKLALLELTEKDSSAKIRELTKPNRIRFLLRKWGVEEKGRVPLKIAELMKASLQKSLERIRLTSENNMNARNKVGEVYGVRDEPSRQIAKKVRKVMERERII